jgi:HlyD family secretion protein
MPQSPGTKKRRGRAVRIFVFVGVIAAAVALVWYFTRPSPVEVAVWRVDRGPVESAVANTKAGTVQSSRRAKLAPAAGGLVSRLEVREGDAVKQDDILLVLWSEDLKAQLKLARSQAATARSHAREVCLNAEQLEREYQRQHELHKEGIAAPDRLERAQSEADAAKAACEAAHASAEERAASIEVAEAALERTRLQAPFDGTVAKLNVELGEYVTPSPPGIPTLPAVDLIEDGPLYVTAPIDEVDAPRLRIGQDARVTLDAFPGREFKGRLRRIAPYVLDVEKQARTVEVEVDLVGTIEDARFLPGYSADVEILIDVRDAVPRVPSEAILEGHAVLVLEGDILVEREVHTGLSNWRYTEITEGLVDGEDVVLSLDREGVEAGARARVTRRSSAERPRR